MTDQTSVVDIRPILQRLWPDPEKEKVTASEIADAIALIFTNQLSPVQTGSLLTALHFTGWDRRADVLAQSSAAMRKAAAPVDYNMLAEVIAKKGRPEGRYNGGLVRYFVCLSVLDRPDSPAPILETKYMMI